MHHRGKNRTVFQAISRPPRSRHACCSCHLPIHDTHLALQLPHTSCLVTDATDRLILREHSHPTRPTATSLALSDRSL